MKILKKVGMFGTGFLIHRAINITNGFVVSPIIVAHFTYSVSVLFMSLISVILGYSLIKIYDWIKQDLLLIESLKQAHIHHEEGVQQNSITRHIVKLTKKSKYLLLFGLAIWDPVVAVLYYRKGAFLYNGFPDKQTVRLFFASALLCNIFWAGIVWVFFFLLHFLINLILK